MFSKNAKPQTTAASVREHPAVVQAQADVARISAATSATQRKLDAALIARASETSPTERRRQRAEALVAGETISAEMEIPAVGEIQAIRDELRTLRDAGQIARDRLDRAERDASAEILAAVAPELEKAAAELAKQAVAFSESAEAFHARLTEMRDAGVRIDLRYQTMPSLEPFRALVADNVLNRMVRTLAETIGLRVRRAMLEAAEADRQERDRVEAEERHKRMRGGLGGGVAAGPEGVTVYRPGKPPVHTPTQDPTSVPVGKIGRGRRIA